MSKFTTALAACGIHHVAIPKNNRKSSDWDCPYCRIAELEVKLETYRKIDKKRFIAMTEAEGIMEDMRQIAIDADLKSMTLQAQVDAVRKISLDSTLSWQQKHIATFKALQEGRQDWCEACNTETTTVIAGSSWQCADCKRVKNMSPTPDIQALEDKK